jgi:EmrB/QacA subfamily drug resistance transporter
MNIDKKDKSNYGLLMVSLLMGSFLINLAASTINVALPSLIAHFNTNLDTLKWAMTGFLLASGIIAPITCFLGEKFSYKKIYFLSILGFTLTSVFCAISWNVQSLIVFRTIQGCFYGIAVPVTMTIIFQVVPKEKQAFSMGIWSLASSVGPAIGPTLSGFLIQGFGWESIFLINIPFGILTALIIIKAVPKYKLNPPEKLDLAGFITCLVASILLLTVFSEGVQWGWLSSKTIMFLITGTSFLIIFIYREIKTKNPVLNLRIFTSRTFTLSIIVRGIIMMSLYAGALLTPLFLQNAQHVSALDTGLILLPASSAMAVFGLIAGKLYNKMDPRKLMVTGIILMAVGSFFLARLSLETSYAYTIAFMTIRNIGIALAMGTVTMVGMESLDKKESGDGSSISNWVSQSIGCLSTGIFMAQLVYLTQQHADSLVLTDAASQMGQELISNQSFVMGINDVYFISVIIVSIALPICLLLKKGNQEEHAKLKSDERAIISE